MKEIFNYRFKGIPKFVSDFNDFDKVNEGNLLEISVQDPKGEFSAFLERKEQDKGIRKIYLQYEEVVSLGGFPVKKEIKVTEYNFPLKGKISIKHFLDGKIRDYKVVRN